MKEKIAAFFKQKVEIIKREITSEPPKKKIKNYINVLIGAFLLAMGTEIFIVPLNIVCGGVSSLAIIFHAIPGFEVISVETYILIINWIYFFIGLFLLGVKYSLKTFVVTIFYPIFVLFIHWFVSVFVINGVAVLDLTQIQELTINGTTLSSDATLSITYIVAAFLGAFLNGAGVGYALVGGGSSGGTDVQVILMNKFFRVPIGTASFISDFIIILAGFFANGESFLITLVGTMTAFLVSLTLEKVYNGKSSYYMAYIVSKKWRDINKYILEEIGRGTTIIPAKGGFSEVDTHLLEVCFDRQEYSQIEHIINKIDPNAFVIVMRTQEIVGYGFTTDTPPSDALDYALSPYETERILLEAKKKREKENEK